MKMNWLVLATLLTATAPLPAQARLLRAHPSFGGDEPALDADDQTDQAAMAVDEGSKEPADEEPTEDSGFKKLEQQVAKMSMTAKTDPTAAAAEAKGLSAVAEMISKTLDPTAETKGLSAVAEMISKILEPEILKEHESAKSELKALEEAFGKCQDPIGNGSAAAALFAKSDEKDKEHQECRLAQETLWKEDDSCKTTLTGLKNGMDAICSARDAVEREPSEAADDCHASPAQNYGTWLMDLKTLFNQKYEEWNKLETQCLNATASHVAQVPVCESKASTLGNKKVGCDAVQAKMEDVSCSAHATAQVACMASDECYNRAKETYDDRKHVIQAEEQARKVNSRVFKRMQCLIEIIEKKGSAEDVEKCRNKTTSTEHLGLTYFDVPAKPECVVIQSVPCSTAFNVARYGGLPPNSPAAKCNACPDLSGASSLFSWEPTMATGTEICAADTAFEYIKGWDCGGSDLAAEGVKVLGESGWREDFDKCSTECAANRDCTGFNYPSPGNGNCWIKHNLRKSVSRGWDCGGANSNWQFFTKLPGGCQASSPTAGPTAV